MSGPVAGETGRTPLRLEGYAVGYPTHRGPGSVLRPTGPRVVVSAIEATARPGEVTALLGPNGAGKSTLLRSIVGLQPLLAGRALLGDVDLARLAPRTRARRVAVVLTDRVDAGLLTGREVAELGRHPYRGFGGRLDPAERRLVQDCLALLHAEGFADQRFAELSDGQRQRVLLARALVQQPALLVLDEPSAFLDVGARVDLMKLLGDLARERDLVVLLSTHEVELALRTVQRVWLLHDGRLVSGTTSELVDSGVLAAVFETATTGFNPHSRTFELRRVGP